MSGVHKEEYLTSRERVLAALSAQEPDRVPFALSFYPTILSQTRGKDADAELGTDVRFVKFDPPRQQNEFLEYLGHLPSRISLGALRTLHTYFEWGYHPEEQRAEPLREARTIDDISLFPFPNVTEENRYRHLGEEVRSIKSRGLPVVGSPPHLGGEIFETAQRLRGFERLMSDFFLNPELVEYLFKQLASIAAESVAILARAGVDIICLDDDVGEPTRMIISAELWRRFLKGHLVEMIKAARAVNPDVRILYHSDGFIEPILPDLVEIGVNAVNPVQPDVMDPMTLKRKFGSRLAFWGTVGSALDWTYGSPDMIKSEVKKRIETVGRGGGLVLAPAYDLEPEVNWDNVVAFVKAAREFG